MLTITEHAAAVLVENRKSAGVPDTYAVRIFAAIQPGGGARGVAVGFVREGEPGDEVTEQEGVTAFVAPEVTALLDEAVLDSSPIDGGEELVIHR